MGNGLGVSSVGKASVCFELHSALLAERSHIRVSTRQHFSFPNCSRENERTHWRKAPSGRESGKLSAPLLLEIMEDRTLGRNPTNVSNVGKPSVLSALREHIREVMVERGLVSKECGETLSLFP